MLSIFLIGIALSIDAFSVALSIGVNNISSSKRIQIALTIGVMHFFMPLIGNILGDQIFNIININPKLIVSIIFIYLALVMLLDKKNDKDYKLTSFISIFLIAFSVSIDSFSIGFGLTGLTDKHLLSFLIFSLCSGCITYAGLILGKYSLELLKDKAKYFGIIILTILAVVNLCQIFS